MWTSSTTEDSRRPSTARSSRREGELPPEGLETSLSLWPRDPNEGVWRFRSAVAALARRSRSESETRGRRFRTGWIVVSGRAGKVLAMSKSPDVQSFAARHADGDSGSIGAWSATRLQPGLRAGGKMAVCAARNAVAIADGRGEVLSAFSLNTPENHTLMLWTVFGPEPATLVFLAGELPSRSGDLQPGISAS